jgi:hypothetical protein
VELINLIGTRIHVRPELAERLVALGYTSPEPAQPPKPPRRKVTRRGGAAR